MPAWAPTASLYLLMFDVSEDRIRRRLDRLLADLGFLSPQFSIRLGCLTPGEVRRLKRALDRWKGEEAHFILLPLGKQVPSALVWGKPIGMSQVPWEDHPGHPPVIHVGYPGTESR